MDLIDDTDEAPEAVALGEGRQLASRLQNDDLVEHGIILTKVCHLCRLSRALRSTRSSSSSKLSPGHLQVCAGYVDYRQACYLFASRCKESIELTWAAHVRISRGRQDHFGTPNFEHKSQAQNCSDSQ